MSLITLVFAGNGRELRRRVEAGEAVDQQDRDQRTPLMHAVIDRRQELVDLLLELGASPNAQDRAGCGPLHFAVDGYAVDIVNALLVRGATVDLEDAHGNTPLNNAVFHSRGRMEVIQRLLRAGADKYRKNKHGVSPADLAKSIANYQIEL